MRVWGAGGLVADVAGFRLCKGWVVLGSVPVQWVCALGIAIGGYMLVFPAKSRELQGRSKMR